MKCYLHDVRPNNITVIERRPFFLRGLHELNLSKVKISPIMSHLVPSPVKPGLHSQKYLPVVSSAVHRAYLSQASQEL